ncbi:MAG TPA: hypothetical protein VFE63_06875 [Roseiarcus sp.]|nr:hypothetical protein [Roseiarcus sp.]
MNFNAATVLADDPAARLAAAEAAAAKALSMAPDHAYAHLVMGLVFGLTKCAEQGIAECERALALDRNFAGARGIMGFQKILLGRAEETEADVQEALRLSPRDPWVFAWTWFAGAAKSFLDQPEEALV